MQDNIFNKFFITVLFIFSGILIGILLSPYISTAGVQILLGMGAFLMVIAIYSAVRIFITGQRKILKSPEESNKKTEVGFVVDTFQELVGNLKEKERELEKLRAIAEDRAVRMETYNENILQSVPSGVVSIDSLFKIRSMNQAAEKILGISAGDAIKKDCAAVFDEPFLSIIGGNKIINRGEYPYVTRGGRHIWLGVTTSQLMNAVNESIGFILIFTDLTDVRALQVQVELKKRFAQLWEMSAGIAHEIRNPMSVIACYARLLDKKAEARDKTAVKGILTEIKNIDEIISEFLAFAKPTDLNKAALNLQGLIEETVATVIGDNPKIKISIKFGNPLSVMGDEILLRQAFTNLFTNAVDAMPDGGNLDIGLNGLSEGVEIIIRDSGCGIPEREKQKIFLPFYTTKQKGIGLGLAIVQKVIVSHSGSIEVESREGEGSKFRIILPLAT